jgi:recombination protein RecA
MSKLAALAAAVGPETDSKDSKPASKGKKEEPVSSKADRFEQLRALEKALNKQFDTTGSLQILGNRLGIEIPSIATLIPSLDNDVLGCGGVPRGRIIEVYGPESSGKTTFCLHLVATEQKNTDNLCAYIDAEHALDVNYADKLGVNIKELLISQPDSGEQALETAIALVESKAVSLIIIDSVAALVPQAELDGEMGDSHMGLQARLMSQAMRKLRGIAASNGVTVVFINQIREKVGVMFGSPEVTTGGRALKFYASVRLDVRRREIIGEKEHPIGHVLEIKAVKNKVGSPLRSTKVNLMYGIGIDVDVDFIEYCVTCGAIGKSDKGGYYNFNDKVFAQGLTSAVECVKLDLNLRKAIQDRMVEIRKEQK